MVRSNVTPVKSNHNITKKKIVANPFDVDRKEFAKLLHRRRQRNRNRIGDDVKKAAVKAVVKDVALSTARSKGGDADRKMKALIRADPAEAKEAFEYFLLEACNADLFLTSMDGTYLNKKEYIKIRDNQPCLAHRAIKNLLALDVLCVNRGAFFGSNFLTWNGEGVMETYIRANIPQTRKAMEAFIDDRDNMKLGFKKKLMAPFDEQRAFDSASSSDSDDELEVSNELASSSLETKEFIARAQAVVDKEALRLRHIKIVGEHKILSTVFYSMEDPNDVRSGTHIVAIVPGKCAHGYYRFNVHYTPRSGLVEFTIEDGTGRDDKAEDVVTLTFSKSNNGDFGFMLDAYNTFISDMEKKGTETFTVRDVTTQIIANWKAGNDAVQRSFNTDCDEYVLKERV